MTTTTARGTTHCTVCDAELRPVDGEWITCPGTKDTCTDCCYLACYGGCCEGTPLDMQHAVYVTGHASGQTYLAHPTGCSWNTLPVMAFTRDQLTAIIERGDGVDDNGFGLTLRDGEILDVFDDTEAEELPTIRGILYGHVHTLYITEGREWTVVDD